jgi:type I restriction enzyme S subunit
MEYLDPDFRTLPKSWTVYPLRDVAEIHNTHRVPLSALERMTRKGIYPYCGANGIVDSISDYRFDGEYVLVAEDGGYWGKLQPSSYVMRGKFWVNNHAHVICGRDGLANNLFLSCLLNFMNILPLIGGDARGKLTKSILEKLPLVVPPLAEQENIAQVLAVVQSAITQQERILHLTSEMKKGLLNRLFTQGIRCERARETEIGLIPESWNVVELITAVEQIDYGISAPIPKTPPENGVKIVSTADITKDGRLLYQKIRRIEAPEKIVNRLTLQTGDVLFNWRNSAELIGKSAVFIEQDNPHVFASFILRIKCDEKKYHNFFLAHLMNYYRETSVFLKLARRAVNQANYNRNEISVLKIPKPTYREQREIADAIAAVDAKVHHHRQKKLKLEDLFRTMLHQLMTAQIRVNDINLPSLEEPT